ncbi:MAG: replication initiator protein A [Gemmataceae bacterium]
MNLVECPLSAVSDRFLDGRKTVVFRDQVWDPDRKAFLKRELAISGSDRYGLPTAKDEDVLLACVQLSARQDFGDRQVRFSRYELLKLLRWPDEGKSYQRLSQSLRRWKGVTVYSDRAFYDHARKSWVTRDFGVFDNLSVYEREASERAAAPRSSWLVWNEVFFDSFRSGYLKKLDWDLYCRLQDPVAKRLYRLLDKRFYNSPEVVFDLKELAVRKVRLSDNYDTAQIKRALVGGIRELEAVWELHPLPAEERFRKVRRGEWQVVFGRKRARPAAKAKAADPAQVELLVTRGVSRGVAEDLAARHSDTIANAVRQFDTHAAKGRPRGAGFLVDAVRNPDKYAGDAEPAPAAAAATRASALNRRPAPRRDDLSPAEAQARSHESTRWRAFSAFWRKLDAAQRDAFEAAAVAAATSTKADGYHRLRAVGGPAFQHYRRVVLRDHFERSAQS